MLALDLRSRGIDKWNKGDGTPVTEADLAVDTFLKERLRAARPDYGWLSEETADDKARLAHERVWIIDPIDGTRSFMENGDEWCVSAALVENGAPVLAAIYCPPTSDLFLATLGGGATLNGSPIEVSAYDHIQDARILAREAVFQPRRWAGHHWPHMHFNMRKSIALRLCLVASADFDASFAIGNTSDWDIAAAHLIVTEAGGLVTTLHGDVPVYNRESTRHPGILASGPILHSQFVELLPRFSG